MSAALSRAAALNLNAWAVVPPGLWVLSLPIFLASCMETGLRAFVMGSVLLSPPYTVAADTLVTWVATATFFGLPQVRRARENDRFGETLLTPRRVPAASRWMSLIRSAVCC